jgi:hypothetical protein
MPGQRAASNKDYIRWRVTILEKPDSALANGSYLDSMGNPILDADERRFFGLRI